jgi:hypothetical protein
MIKSKISLAQQFNAAVIAGNAARQTALLTAAANSIARQKAAEAAAEARIKQDVQRLIEDAADAARLGRTYLVLFKHNGEKQPTESDLGEHQLAMLTLYRAENLAPYWIWVECPPGVKGISHWEMRISLLGNDAAHPPR